MWTRWALTCVDKTAGHVTTKLFALERQSDITRTRMTSRWHLDLDCMRCHQFTPDNQRTKDNLQALEKVITNNDNRCATIGPALARTYGFDLWSCNELHWRVILTCIIKMTNKNQLLSISSKRLWRTLSPPEISDGSLIRLVRRPCFELLCTNMLSDTASRTPSTHTLVDMTTWKRRISRGLPAFFKQFWLHFKKNLRKNL